MNGFISLKLWLGYCCKVLLYNLLILKKIFLVCLFIIRNLICINYSILL